MRRAVAIALVVWTACARADGVVVDATAVDADIDASACMTSPAYEPVEVTCDDVDNDCDGTADNVAAPPVWYADADGDGHGDPAVSMARCDAPVGHVAVGDDCDDTQPLSHPGAAELCDGLDNDCAATTTEVCSAGCVVRVRVEDNHRYLFCAVAATWTAAQAACAAQQFRLVRVDDQAEHTYVRTTATAAVGNVDVWLGGNDAAAEGAWRWDDGVQFWQGGAGGVAVGGLFESWGSGEPNNDNNEDCLELRTGNDWNDVGCGSGQAFVCERW